jgi:hypothetical protein
LVEDDDPLWLKHNNEVFLAGCVPDGYAVRVKGKLYLPTKKCVSCNKCFDFVDFEEAL